MKGQNNQYPLNSVSKFFNAQFHFIQFLSYILILGFGISIGVIFSLYLKDCNFSLQFTQLSLSSFPRTPPLPPPTAKPEISNQSQPRTQIQAQTQIQTETQMEIKECREEEDKHKIYTGSVTTRAYVQSPSNHWFLRFPITL